MRPVVCRRLLCHRQCHGDGVTCGIAHLFQSVLAYIDSAKHWRVKAVRKYLRETDCVFCFTLESERKIFCCGFCCCHSRMPLTYTQQGL